MKKDNLLAVLRDFKREHAEQYGIIEIGLFGSVARDEAREDSDVDIWIKTKTPNPFILVHIKEDLEKIINKRVEIVRVRDKMNPFLRKNIEKDGCYA